MRAYTKNEIEAIMLLGYARGFQDGRQRVDRVPSPEHPTLEDVGIKHPLTSSDDPANMRKRNSWLDGMAPAR